MWLVWWGVGGSAWREWGLGHTVSGSDELAGVRGVCEGMQATCH